MELDANSTSAEEINNSTASNEADKSARLPRFVFPSYTNIFGFPVHIMVFGLCFRFLSLKFASGQTFQVLYLKNAHDLEVKMQQTRKMNCYR